MPYDQNLAERIRKAPGNPGLLEKKMFGGIGFLLNGNMACGVHQQSLVVRIAKEEHQAALAQPGVRPFDLTGKPMAGWILVDPQGIVSDDDLNHWVEQSIAFAASLPAK